MRPSESFIEQPVRSLQTMLRVIAQDNAGMPTVIPDGIYGPSTMTAVSSFQRHYGLPVTGITDQNTWEKIVSVYEPASIRTQKAQPIEVLLDPGKTLMLGDSHPYIYLAQAMLLLLAENHTALPQPDINGILDAVTADAIAQFQRLSGLEETGLIDLITWKHLVLQFTLDAHRRDAKTE